MAVDRQLLLDVEDALGRAEGLAALAWAWVHRVDRRRRHCRRVRNMEGRQMMNLQRREEIRGLIAEITRYEELGATLDLESKARDAITELLAHIDTLEQSAEERVIARGAVVKPHTFGEVVNQVRAIPADRVPGEGVVALRRFAERCAQRDHQPDEHIGRAKCVACEAEDALRANQGGADE